MTEKQIPPPIDRETWQADIAMRHGIGDVAVSNLAEPLGINDVPEEPRAFDALTRLITDRVWKGDEAAQGVKDVITGLRQQHKALHAESGNPFLTSSDDSAPSLLTTIMTNPVVKEYVDGRDLQSSHDRLVETWPRFMQTYRHGVQRGITEGYLPPTVFSRLDSAFALTKTRLIDSPVLDTYSRNFTAFYLHHNDEVDLRDTLAGANDNGVALVSNLGHEYTHKLSGGTFQPVTDENFAREDIAARSRIGFATETDIGVTKRSGLNEAVTHHATQAILHGDFETIDPNKRSNDDGVYYGRRKVLSDFVTKAQGLISVKTLLHGYFEDTGPDGSSEDRSNLVGEAVSAYGQGAFNKLERLFAIADVVGEDPYMEVLLSRIHAAEFDANGNMTKQGFIDTDTLPSEEELGEILDSTEEVQ